MSLALTTSIPPKARQSGFGLGRFECCYDYDYDYLDRIVQLSSSQLALTAFIRRLQLCPRPASRVFGCVISNVTNTIIIAIYTDSSSSHRRSPLPLSLLGHPRFRPRPACQALGCAVSKVAMTITMTIYTESSSPHRRITLSPPSIPPKACQSGFGPGCFESRCDHHYHYLHRFVKSSTPQLSLTTFTRHLQLRPRPASRVLGWGVSNVATTTTTTTTT